MPDLKSALFVDINELKLELELEPFILPGEAEKESNPFDDFRSASFVETNESKFVPEFNEKESNPLF